jgi:hypothetical protein
MAIPLQELPRTTSKQLQGIDFYVEQIGSAKINKLGGLPLLQRCVSETELFRCLRKLPGMPGR